METTNQSTSVSVIAKISGVNSESKKTTTTMHRNIGVHPGTELASTGKKATRLI